MYSLLGIIIVLCACCISLASSAGNCTDLNANLFGGCISVGINGSLVSADLDEVADILKKTLTKFQQCSPALAGLMACSIDVPKCGEGSSGEAVLPCKEVCNTFVSQCRVHQDGMEFVRKLCLLLSPESDNGTCLRPDGFKNISTVAEPSGQTCKKLDVRQCSGLGYNQTTLSSNAQLKLQDSDTMNKIENASIPIKWLVCAELVPPCFPGGIDTLFTACKSSCIEASQNYSEQFIGLFNNTEYCTGLPDQKGASGGQFCVRHTWPKSGFWPEGLRWSLSLQESSNGGMNATTASPTNAPVEVTAAAGNITTPRPTGAVETPQSNATSLPSPNSTVTMAPATNASTLKPKNSTDEPTTMPKNSTTSPPTTKAASASPSTTNMTTAPVTTPNSTTNEPATTLPRNVTTTPPTTKAASASPSTANMTTAPVTTPNSTTNESATTLPGNVTTSPPTTKAASASPSIAPTTNTTAVPVTTSNSTTPVASTPPATKATSESSSKESTRKGTSTQPNTITSTGKGDVHAKKKPQKTSGMSGGAIAGAAIGSICGLVLIIALAVFLIRRRRISVQYSHRVMVDMDDL